MGRIPRSDRDSPVEYTGEAHLVTVSCVECSDTVKVSESAAAGGIAVTCENCTHECLDHLKFLESEDRRTPDDGTLPYMCMKCGDRFSFNIKTGEHTKL